MIVAVGGHPGRPGRARSNDSRGSPGGIALAAVAVVAGCVLLTCRDAATGPAADGAGVARPAVPLAPGRSVTGELAAGATDVYSLSLDADVFVSVRVDQPGVDVVARWLDPRGRLLIEHDRFEGTASPEHLRWITGTPGVYRLEIEAYKGASATGSYAVTFEELRPPTERNRKSHAAELLLEEARAGHRDPDLESWREAERKLQQAIDLWREAGDPPSQAYGLYRLARLRSQRDRQLAITTLEPALDLLEGESDAGLEAVVLHHLGFLHSQEGQLRRAVDFLEQALPFRRRAGSASGEALTHNRLGLAHKMLGDVDQALEHYRQALELYRQLGAPRWESRTFHNLGKAYLSFGMLPEALDSLDQALEIRQRLGDRRDTASTLNAIGQAHLKAGDGERSLEIQLRALELSHQVEDRSGEALALCGIALAYQELGRLEEALEPLTRALATYRDLGHLNSQATVLHNVGWVLDALGEDARATEHYRQALSLFEATGHRQGRIMTLHSMALVERQGGDLARAREHLETALAEIERVRAKPSSHTVRYSYFATKQEYYETYVDLLMELHRRQPDAGYAARALSASERARARSQLDALTESGADLKRGAAPTLLEREQSLESDIAALELQRQELQDEGDEPTRLAALERRLRSLFLEHDRVQANIRIASPHYAALTQPQPLAADEIRRRVLDRDTILLEYALGEKRSFLWAVTPEAIRSFELPPREVIEKLAGRAYQLLSSSHLTASRVPTELALARLSDVLLRPAAGLLGRKRLLIVADGALQYIPFGALPEPATDDHGAAPGAAADRPPLAAGHEIVSMPSASTLAVLRDQLERRPRPAGTIAVVADPVFALADPRFDQGSDEPTSSVARGSPTLEPRDHDRLIYSRREAEDILALVPADKAFAALGFAADRETVMSGVLANYRFIHFATHGELNTAHPALSHLVLSKFDREGSERQAVVFAHEIYNLDLAADLVVLSACETALGAEIRGEGLLGLTQGFMYAGATSVLVSLWNVDDRATAELMASFYRELLVADFRPAAALRAAQITIRQEREWQAPYYWAGFVLQGDWR